MADDIDDLLDEVESKYCSSSSSGSTGSATKKIESKVSMNTGSAQKNTGSAQKNSTKSSKKDDLSDVIDDIMSDDGFNVSLQQKEDAIEKSGSSKEQPSSVVKMKCFTIRVGGSHSTRGLATGSKQRICDRLHCTTCDNSVVMFDNFKWLHDQCDYLAFRNKYPDFSRLKALMSPLTGYRAYCCQCSWLATNEVIDLKSKYSFKWICKRHDNYL